LGFKGVVDAASGRADDRTAVLTIGSPL